MTRSVSPWPAQKYFTLKVKTLEKRITQHYEKTQDADLAVRMVLILQVRGSITTEEIQQPMRHLIRQIFQTTKLRRSVRRWFFYFRDCFTAQEWQVLLARLKRTWPRLVKQVRRHISAVVMGIKKEGRSLLLTAARRASPQVPQASKRERIFWFKQFIQRLLI
ncbi:hypothetical protein [Enterococcus sp. CSURQ0835]|uniref:hypothetical protein n=1 Tax=Enterococcus sp. CSURQ0835 TaxID=2681394 RepID=UPI00135947C5|nr:hypothetical protein [Enterococcus sp. CSURQ0835]